MAVHDLRRARRERAVDAAMAYVRLSLAYAALAMARAMRHAVRPLAPPYPDMDIDRLNLALEAAVWLRRAREESGG